MKKWILIAIATALPFAVFAQDEEVMTEEEASIDRDPAAAANNKNDGTPLTQKARYRLYPGGQDEQDLQVRTALPQPQRTHDAPVTQVQKSSGEE